MFKNYLATTVRSLLKHKGYAVVNILGLAVGMACCILILLYVQDELSYDHYHDNAHRIYRVVDGANTKTPPLLAPVMQQEFPEVLDFARIRSPYGVWMMAYGDKTFYERRVFWADDGFFDFFSWRLLAGDPKTALAEPFGVVISEATAQKYFDREDPMGKIIHADQGFADLKVTGVMQNTPPNSHFKADFLVSNVTQESVYDAWRSTTWFDPEYHTYILLPEGYQPAGLARKLPVLHGKYVTPEFKRYGIRLDQLCLQPLTGIHLRSHLENELEDNSDIVYIYILSAVALLVLLIAAINYMNLATARSAGRAREVGMRKVVGAHRWQLISQFLGESVFISLLALLLALLLLQIILPAFAVLSGKTLTVVDLDRPGLLPALLGFAVLVGLFAGSYPASFLSALPPVAVLKGAGMMRSSRAGLRKGLVLVQFAVSIMLLIGSGVLYDQLSYISDRRLGFAKDQVVILPGGIDEVGRRYKPLRDALLQNPGILGVTRATTMPGQTGGKGILRPSRIRLEGMAETESLDLPTVNMFPDFIRTLGIEMAAGRDFSPDFVTATDGIEVILNETAARHLGWSDPSSAIGHPIQFSDEWGRVIGVVRDFHMRSLHEPITPLVLVQDDSDYLLHFAVRIRPEDIPRTLDFIEQQWKALLPEFPFEISFLSNEFADMYQSENRLGQVFGAFTLITIFLACSGVFGLASFMVQQRTREIGIRKVLGASLARIILLLTREFVILALVANLIAWPVAFLAVRSWLQNFAYRTPLGLQFFVLSSVLVLLIILLTISYQAVKAALANPTETLQYE